MIEKNRIHANSGLQAFVNRYLWVCVWFVCGDVTWVSVCVNVWMCVCVCVYVLCVLLNLDICDWVNVFKRVCISECKYVNVQVFEAACLNLYVCDWVGIQVTFARWNGVFMFTNLAASARLQKQTVCFWHCSILVCWRLFPLVVFVHILWLVFSVIYFRS